MKIPQMRLEIIDISKIKVSEYHRKLSKAHMSYIVESISKNGFLVPIVVVENHQGEYICIDGQHRLEAVRYLGGTVIPAVIVDTKEESILAFNIEKANSTRDKAQMTYSMYVSLLSRLPELNEEDIADFVEPAFITLGILSSEFSLPPTNYILNTYADIDSFLPFPLKEAYKKRQEICSRLSQLLKEYDDVATEIASRYLDERPSKSVIFSFIGTPIGSTFEDLFQSLNSIIVSLKKNPRDLIDYLTKSKPDYE